MSKIVKYANLASGDIVPFIIDGDGFYIDENSDIEEIKKQINLNRVNTSFRIFVLYPDETVNYEIPRQDIKIGGNYSENYQNGQRRSLSFSLNNESGKYSPNINVLWAGSRLRLDVGLVVSGETIWFYKGIYIINKITPNKAVSGKEVSISAGDKFSLFENSTGKLEESYEIEPGSDIEEIITSIQKIEMGDGSVFDAQPLIYHSSFHGKKTQVTISKSAGDTYGSILLELATQLSAEIFYNANGNLVLLPLSEITKDDDKPLIYDFNSDKGGLSQLSFDYDYNTIVNRIIVIGNSSSTGGVYRAVAVNADEKSPLCYQRIGYRTGNIINDSNIVSDVLAEERAEYELRQQLILKTTTTASILFNPFLSVNNLISISDNFFNLNHDKFLLQSLSCPLDYSGKMDMTFSNIDNIYTEIEITSNITPKKVPDNIIINLDEVPVHVIGEDNSKKNLYIDNISFSESENSTSGGTERTFKKDSIIYLFAVIDSKYFKAQSEWRYINRIGDQELYLIPMIGRSYCAPDGIGILVEDPSKDGRGIRIDNIMAICPDVDLTIKCPNGISKIYYRIKKSINNKTQQEYSCVTSDNTDGVVLHLSSSDEIMYYSETTDNYHKAVYYNGHPGIFVVDRDTEALTPEIVRNSCVLRVEINGQETINVRVSYLNEKEENIENQKVDYSQNIYVACGSKYRIQADPIDITYKSFDTGEVLIEDSKTQSVQVIRKAHYVLTSKIGNGLKKFDLTYKDFNDKGEEKTVTCSVNGKTYVTIEGEKYKWSNVVAEDGYEVSDSEKTKEFTVWSNMTLRPKVMGWHQVFNGKQEYSGKGSGTWDLSAEISGIDSSRETRISGILKSGGVLTEYAAPVSFSKKVIGASDGIPYGTKKFGPASGRTDNHNGSYRYRAYLGAEDNKHTVLNYRGYYQGQIAFEWYAWEVDDVVYLTVTSVEQKYNE